MKISICVNYVDHSLTCKQGGCTRMSHNSVADSRLMREVCRDVQIKPTLLKITQNKFKRKVFTADNAMLDISARGLWNRTFVILLTIDESKFFLSIQHDFFIPFIIMFWFIIRVK